MITTDIMKQTLGTLWYLSLLWGLAPSAAAADQTWTGQISDSMCGESHAQMIAEKYKDFQTSSGEPSGDCTLACIKNGGKYVLVIRGKAYLIVNQKFSALQLHAGHTVRLTGRLQGDTIRVSKIAAAASK